MQIGAQYAGHMSVKLVADELTSHARVPVDVVLSRAAPPEKGCTGCAPTDVAVDSGTIVLNVPSRPGGSGCASVASALAAPATDGHSNSTTMASTPRRPVLHMQREAGQRGANASVGASSASGCDISVYMWVPRAVLATVPPPDYPVYMQTSKGVCRSDPLLFVAAPVLDAHDPVTGARTERGISCVLE
jgi:hypothetical protein